MEVPHGYEEPDAGRPPHRHTATKGKRTIANLPDSTRRLLSRQAAKSRQRHGQSGRVLEDRNREQLYEVAKQRDIAGRSKMGKWELIDAIRASR